MAALIAGNFEGRDAQGGLRGDRRRRRGRHRGRADPRRLGDDGAARGGSCSSARSCSSLGILAMTPLRRGRAAQRAQAPARRRRHRPVGHRPRADRPRRRSSRAPGAGSSPKDSPVEPFGFSLTLVRDRRRRRADLGVRPVAAPPRARPGSDPLVHLDLIKIAPLRCRPRRPVHPEPDPHGRVLHDPPVPAAGARARRPGDRPQDAARLDRDVHRLGRRARGCPTRYPSARSCGPGSRSRRRRAVLLLAHDPAGPRRRGVRARRWPCSAWGWASWRRSSATSSSRRSTPPAAARPAAAVHRASSWGLRWASR